MIGHEENQEEVTFKVTDRRKFNPDGSLKDGVEIEPEAPKAAAPPPEPKPEPAFAAKVDEPVVAAIDGAEGDGEDDIPGADDPASFVNFLSTFATNAAAALGWTINASCSALLNGAQSNNRLCVPGPLKFQ